MPAYLPAYVPARPPAHLPAVLALESFPEHRTSSFFDISTFLGYQANSHYS